MITKTKRAVALYSYFQLYKLTLNLHNFKGSAVKRSVSIFNGTTEAPRHCDNEYIYFASVDGLV
jgi:hypothetical protein